MLTPCTWSEERDCWAADLAVLIVVEEMYSEGMKTAGLTGVVDYSEPNDIIGIYTPYVGVHSFLLTYLINIRFWIFRIWLWFNSGHSTMAESSTSTKWFDVLFGFSEGHSYESVQSMFSLSPSPSDPSNTIMTSLSNKASYQVGRFTRPTVQDLRSDAIEKGKRGLVRFSHVVTPSDGVFGMHCDRTNEGATFQAASQFNCLEFTSSSGVPENVRHIVMLYMMSCI